MTRSKRPLIYGAIFAFVLLLGIVFWFYRSTRHTLERAEAFAFRRMTVAQQGEEGTYRFFYVSNRRLEPGDGTLEQRFTNQREGKLRFGSFDTRIQANLSLGMIVNPTDWFTTDALDIVNVHDREQPAFVEKLTPLNVSLAARNGVSNGRLLSPIGVGTVTM